MTASASRARNPLRRSALIGAGLGVVVGFTAANRLGHGLARMPTGFALETVGGGALVGVFATCFLVLAVSLADAIRQSVRRRSTPPRFARPHDEPEPDPAESRPNRYIVQRHLMALAVGLIVASAAVPLAVLALRDAPADRLMPVAITATDSVSISGWTDLKAVDGRVSGADAVRLLNDIRDALQSGTITLDGRHRVTGRVMLDWVDETGTAHRLTLEPHSDGRVELSRHEYQRGRYEFGWTNNEYWTADLSDVLRTCDRLAGNDKE
jgi:hypothetical protein